jgi:hypothetical protein
MNLIPHLEIRQINHTTSRQQESGHTSRGLCYAILVVVVVWCKLNLGVVVAGSGTG